VPLSERVHGHGSAAPPQDVPAERFGLDTIRKQGHAGENGVGNENGSPRLPAQTLQAGGRVHDVAEIGDLTPVDADLGRDDTAAMKRCAEFRDEAEARDPAAALRAERSADGEDAGDASCLFDAAHERPGDDHLIADVIVDLTAMPADRFGDGRENVPQQFLCGEIAPRFRVGGRADEIEEEEDALLADRAVVATEDQVAERTRTAVTRRA
jgi:hypothetical protein